MADQNGEIVIVQTVTEIPPETKAAIGWLQMRRPARLGDHSMGSWPALSFALSALKITGSKDISNSAKIPCAITGG